MALDLTGFEPAELGFDSERFPEYRDVQLEAAEEILNDPKRFYGASIPPGGGKSLLAMTLAKASGKRTCILTANHGLTDQYNRDFESAGLVDIRGKGNYECAGSDFKVSCRFGPIDGCKLTGNLGCSYECKRYEAKQAQVVLTNYAYWTRINERTRGLELTTKEGGPNSFELLILDEAHRAFDELSKSMQVTVRESWIKHVVKSDVKKSCGEELVSWKQFAASVIPVIDRDIQGMYENHRKRRANLRIALHDLEQLKEALERISTMDSGNWVCEMQEGTKYGRVWLFDSIWPGAQSESRLFLGVPKVVLMSATLRPANITIMGVKKDNFTFKEWPRIFPAQRAPVYHVPVKGSSGEPIRINYRMPDGDWDYIIDAVDLIAEQWKDFKGLIHTGSYARQKLLLEKSSISHRMLANTNDPDSDSAQEIYKKHVESPEPTVLVSPSFSTGWDFAGDRARWQIYLKMAFPDTRSKVMTARKQRSEVYINDLTMQDFVQACGRIVRYEEDWGVTIVLDGNVGWFMMQHKHLAPDWFKVQRVAQIPSKIKF